MTSIVLVQDFLKTAQQELSVVCSSEHEAEQEALLLIQHFLKISRAKLFTQLTISLPADVLQLLRNALDERIQQRKPLQYIIGAVPFLELTIQVEAPILIPRPETEEIVTWLLEQSSAIRYEFVSILDLCTGSGCIALALAKGFTQSQVIGVDINPQATALASTNAQLNAIKSAMFLTGSLYEPLPEQYECDLIIANPPYIAGHRYAFLAPEVREWEDYKALVADDNGMALYRAILHKARTVLCKNSIFSQHDLPCIIFEIGIDQEAIVELCHEVGFMRTQIHNDMHGNMRWIAIWQ